jgi:hypothetical protein
VRSTFGLSSSQSAFSAEPWGAAIGYEAFRPDPVPQHIDVELRFWNRRGGRVTILGIAEMKILSRAAGLALAD